MFVLFTNAPLAHNRYSILFHSFSEFLLGYSSVLATVLGAKDKDSKNKDLLRILEKTK